MEKKKIKQNYLNSLQIYYEGFKSIIKEPQEVFSMLQFKNQQRKDGYDFVFQVFAGVQNLLIFYSGSIYFKLLICLFFMYLFINLS